MRTLAWVGAVCTVVLSVSLLRLREQVAGLRGALSTDASQRKGEQLRWRIERANLISVIGAIPPTRPFLVGQEAVSGKPVELIDPSDGVFYFFSPN